MANDDDRNDGNDDTESTVHDPARAPRRMKAGLVPPDTGLYLRIEGGPDAGRTFMLSAGGVYTLGREGADIALSDPKVSRKHAEIGLYGPDAWVVRDLASKNGTTLNGRRVDDKTKLKHWDVIQIGDTPIRFAVVEKSIKVA
jgi:pSer/pThr/pTyr-binding forkhead associated (FHA) protein